MDPEQKDRRSLNSLLGIFAKSWPYIAIVALLGLHALHYSQPPSRRPASPVPRSTLGVSAFESSGYRDPQGSD